MAILKCKMCGGQLDIIDDETVVTCEYCGSKQTIPNVDNEKKLTLFARANRLRLACEFDKAYGVYESIVSEFPEEAEAYWGLVLCKYGIEYVDDPVTGKKIPTCHRSSFECVLEDANFEMTLEYADSVARSVYREEAKAFERIRAGIIEVSSKEEPYDIFICYKETDENGNRTLDSVLAQDVYDALTDKGYKVFFSRITLEDKLGVEYEPYIFAALNSSKIMLVFGTNYEYFNAVWVKNEWSRFLSLIAKGEKKTLIPCYKDIDAYDMPNEFRRLQAQDLGKLGAIQDLLRGIEKILGVNIKGLGKGFTGITSKDGSVLVQRGNMALEDGDFSGAESYFERALDANPFDAQAYLGKFLAIVHAPSLENFKDKVCLLEDSKEFKRAEKFADPELAKELKKFKDQNNLRYERACFLEAIKKITEEKTVNESMMLIAQCTDEAYQQALSLFDTIVKSKCINLKKERDYKKEIKSQYAALKFLSKNLELCSYYDILSGTEGLFNQGRSSLDKLVKVGVLEKHAERYCWPSAKEEKIYQNAKSLMNKDDKSSYLKASDLLNSIEDYKDSKKLAEQCKDFIQGLILNEEKIPKLKEELKQLQNLKQRINRANEKIELLKKQKETFDRLSDNLEDYLKEMRETKESIIENKAKITSLKNKKGSLGLFAGKQKKEIDQQITDLNLHNNNLLNKYSELKKLCEGFSNSYELKDKLCVAEESLDKATIELTNLQTIRSEEEIIGDLERSKEGKHVVAQYQKIQKNKQKYQVGNIVSCGTYDNKKIEWKVLSLTDDKALLITKEAIDCICYNRVFKDVTWETCTLRQWLNNAFMNQVFNGEEKAQILETIVEPHKNPNHDTNQGNATQDKMFLLSIEEVNRYFTNPEERCCKPSYTAKIKGVSTFKSSNCNWLLRTTGDDQRSITIVDINGYVHENGYLVDVNSYGVRPAMWIDLYCGFFNS